MAWTPPQTAAARYHRGWVGTGRSDIISHLVTSMSPYEDLVPLAHGAASAVADVIGAASAHITLIVDDQFCDLVNVGDLDKDMVTFPTRQYYPLDSYPAATACLLSHRGYLSSDGWDGPDRPDGPAGSARSAVVREYIEQSPHSVPASFVGVPIVADGRVFGELFVTRTCEQPPFTHEDLDLLMDLATVLGGRIPSVS